MIRLLLCILLCYSLSVVAQPNNQYIFRHIDQQDGLLHNSVYAITQDQQGFIWIGTPNGLQRYDGLRFKNYEKELMKFSYAVPIENIYADKQNNIWVTSTEIAKINIATNRAVIYGQNDLLNDPAEKFVAYTDERNHKWLLGKNCLYYTDSITGTMALFGLYTPFQSSKLGNLIYYDSLRRCTWVTGGNSLMMFDEKTKNVYTSAFNPTNNLVLKAFADKEVSFFLLDRKGNIWAAEWGSTVYKFNERYRTCFQYQTMHKIPRKIKSAKKKESVTTICMYEDSHGTIWIGNDHDGLLRYNAGGDSLEIVSAKNVYQKGLQYNYNFLCISEDRDGNIWLGTDRGINIFNPYNQYFSSITHEETNPASLPKNEITSFMQDRKGCSYIGTWGGGFSIYDTTGHFKKTIFPEGIYEYPLVWAFAENEDGTIWVGAQHGYIHIYDPPTGKIKTVHPAQANNSTVRCMVKDSMNNIWIGLHNGKIMEWVTHSRIFVEQTTSGLMNNYPIKNIFIDKADRIWASTSKGLLQFDPATRQYIGRFLMSNNSLYPYCSDDINGVEQQNDSTLAVGTMRCGFFFFNIHSKAFTRYTGFPQARATNIYALKKDAAQNLWMTADYHIYQLRMRDKKLVKYDLPPGLMNASFEMCNIYPLQNGNWLTASKTEAVIFNPLKIASSRPRYNNVQITAFKVNDYEINIDSIDSGKKLIRLNSDQNYITIEFTDQSYGGIGKNIFYKLSGIDRNWVKANEKGVASYTNLAPGDYKFIIKAGEEEMNSPATVLTISITPPFYSTWWFQISAILAIIFIIYSFTKRRIKNIRYEAGLRHKIAETEMLALRSQMNPHFIFNCLSAIDNLMQTNQPDKATTYLARFAKLIRSLLESTKHNLVPFYKDFETLQLYIELEQFRSGNKFTYSMVADDELLEGDYKVPPLLVQPFVENAIHHGLMNKLTGQRNLIVTASLKAGTLHYLVKDDGVGRAKAQEIKQRNRPEHNSYGIEISSQRIQLHGKHAGQNNITISDLSCNGQPSGTEVAVNIHIDNP